MVTVRDGQRLIEAEPEEVGLSSVKLQNLTRLVQGYVDSGKIPGAITVVARRGKTVHFETYGARDSEAGAPITADTIFRLYSMTKPITSVALMTLYEEGKFQLDDPVATFIPELRDLKVYDAGTPESYTVRDPARAITVRDTLMHTTGLANGGRSTPGRLFEAAQLPHLRGDGRLKESWTLADMIRTVARLPLQFDPGAHWSYGISTDICASLCEVISGTSFDQFLQQRIFDPLQMTDTGYVVPPSAVDRLAACYRRGRPDEASYVLTDPPGDSRYSRAKTYHSGAGGLTSTAADYLRFCKMLAGGGASEGSDGARILGSRTVELMTINHLSGNRDLASMALGGPSETAMEGIGFGLGFAVLLDPTVAQVIGTPGEYYWGGAASTAFFVSPKEDLILIFLTQLQPSGTYPFRRELRAATYQAIIE